MKLLDSEHAIIDRELPHADVKCRVCKQWEFMTLTRERQGDEEVAVLRCSQCGANQEVGQE